MKHLNELTKKDWEDLFSGKVRYFVIKADKIGCGSKHSVWKVFFWNLFHRNNKLSHGYSMYIFHYSVIIAVIDRVILKWDNEDMRQFETENSLQIGDKVDIYFLVPRDDGSHWCAGGRQYEITEKGWHQIGKIMGA